MTVCKYWSQGNCRNGSNCRFEHATRNNSNNNHNQNQNNRNGTAGIFGRISRPERWNINVDDIRADLDINRPKWILSAYGPGKELPASLLQENEYSPEEVRWRFYQQQAQGNADSADREAIQLWRRADSDMKNIAANASQVQSFMETKEKDHPNRVDWIKYKGNISREEFANNISQNTLPGSSINPFGGAVRATATTNPFSKPAFGQTTSPFGQGNVQQSSAFGQPAQPAQPSVFGKAAFGQSAFGAPVQNSASNTNTAFGKPAFGQPASGFGAGTGFGQSAKSTFGQPISNSSPFGAAAKPVTAPSVFGQPSDPVQNANAFAKPTTAGGFGAGPAFGQAAQPGNSTSPFGPATRIGNDTSPFGHAAASNNTPPAFGQTGFGSNKTMSGFGQASAGNNAQPAFGQTDFGSNNANTGFGQASQSNASPFSQSSAQQSTTSTFGQPPQPGPKSPFGTGSTQPTFGQTGFGQPPQPVQQNSGFGQPQQPPPVEQNTTGQPPAFGQGAFGQQPGSTTFGQANSSFGQGNQTNGGFPAVPQAETSSQGPFAQQPAPATTAAPNSVGTATTSGNKPTTKPIKALHFTQSLPKVPTQFGVDQKPILYRGRPVEFVIKMRPQADGTEVVDVEHPCYRRPDTNKLERIWFPKGAADDTVQKLSRIVLDFQADEEAYTDDVKKQYGYLFETATFQNGQIPLVPPMREWIDYDI